MDRRAEEGFLQRYLVAALFSIVGGALLVLSGPRMVAAWAARGADPALAKYYVGARPTPDELRACEAALEGAKRWHTAAFNTFILGTCEFDLARASTDRARRDELLATAERHIVEALRANPAEGAAWIRLAMVRQWEKKAARAVVLPLLASIEVSPHVRSLWQLRTEMLMGLWPYLTLEEVYGLRPQLLAIWSLPEQRRWLFDMAIRHGRQSDLGWALSADQEADTEFRRLQSERK